MAVKGKQRRFRFSALMIALVVFMVVNIIAVAAILPQLRQERENNVTPDTAKITIQENGDEPHQTSENPMPLPSPDDDGGYLLDKRVEITSTQNDEYLKVAMVPQWYDADGRLCGGLGDANDFGLAQPPDPLTNTQRHVSASNTSVTILTYHLSPDWQDYWRYDASSGFYYYKTILHKGETTRPLLLQVKLSAEAYALCQDHELHIDVIAESTQVSRAFQ